MFVLRTLQILFHRASHYPPRMLSPTGHLIPLGISSTTGHVIPLGISSPTEHVIPLGISSPTEHAIPPGMSSSTGHLIPPGISSPIAHLITHRIGHPLGISSHLTGHVITHHAFYSTGHLIPPGMSSQRACQAELRTKRKPGPIGQSFHMNVNQASLGRASTITRTRPYQAALPNQLQPGRIRQGSASTPTRLYQAELHRRQPWSFFHAADAICTSFNDKCHPPASVSSFRSSGRSTARRLRATSATV